MSLIGTSVRSIMAAAVALSISGTAYAESLSSALEAAYKNSGLLEQNQALLKASDEDVLRAASALLPVLSWTASVGKSYRDSNLGESDSASATLGLRATMPIYDYGRGQLGIDLANEAVQGARQQLIGIEQSVLLNAIEAFMQYRQASELVGLRENNLKVIDQELRAANDRFEVGEITRTDVALAESAKAQSLSALAQARGDLTRARESYLTAIGQAPRSPSAPSNLPDLPDTAAIGKAIAGRGHPDVMAAQSQVSQAEIQLAQAKAAKKPSVSLSGNLSLSDTFNSDSYTNTASVSIEAQMPIYQGGALDASIRQATNRVDAAKAALRFTALNTDMQVGAAYARLTVAYANMEATEQQIEAAQIAFDGVREEATLGARTTLDVLNAEQNLLDAKANRVVASNEVIIALYSVMSALGQLTAENLGLNVDVFDPEAYSAEVEKIAPSMRGLQLDKVLGKLGK